MINHNVVGDINRTKILDLIAEKNNQLTTTDLTNLTKLHRDTIYSNCEKLIEEGYINKTNKKGTYYLTLKAFSNPALKARNFVRETTKRIRQHSLLTEEQISYIISNYLELKENNSDNNIQEHIFSFSLSMGAYITYVLLQSFNPKKWIFTNKIGEKWDKGMNRIKEKDRDEVIRSWVMNSINPSYLLYQFTRLNIIKRYLPIYTSVNLNYLWKNEEFKKLTTEEKRDRFNHLKQVQKQLKKFDPINDPHWSRYRIDEKDFDRLIKSYEQVFPDLYKQFEDINKKMSDEPEKEEEELVEDYDSEGLSKYLDKKGNKI